MTYYNAADSYIAYAIGTDLTAWRNGDAELAAAEVQATDWLWDSFSVQHTDPAVQRIGRLSASYVQHRVTNARIEGQLVSTHFLQRGIFAYMMLGSCSTSGSGPYTHSITLNSSQDPVNYAFRVQRTLNSNDLLHDLLGHVPDTLTITCTESGDTWKARQVFTSKFAYSRAGSTSINEPSKISDTPFDWGHLKDANGALSLTYNGSAVECDIVGLEITLKRNNLLARKDTDGYPAVGKVQQLDFIINLDVIPTGDDLRTIANTKYGSYAGDLDLNIKWYESSSHSLQFNFDKLYLVPTPELVSESEWFEKYTITLEPYDSGSSLTVTAVDNYDDTYYKNP